MKPIAYSFSEMQNLAYNIVKNHCHDTSCDKEPLCLIIIGVAGTGKSYLINALTNLLGSRCAVTATTGKASYNNYKRYYNPFLAKITSWSKR